MNALSPEASPLQTATPSGWPATLQLCVASQTDQVGQPARSALVSNRHRGPLVVQKAFYPEGRDTCHLMIVHPPAGIAQGDTLRIELSVKAHAHALVATPAATRWYKSPARPASQEVVIDVAEDARLEWLPQENLFYDAAWATQRLEIALAASSRLIAWDAFMLGRSVTEGVWQGGDVRLITALSVDGQLVYAEHGHFEGHAAAMACLPQLAALRCGGTLLAYVADGEIDACLAQLLPLPYDQELMVGCSTPVPGLIVLRVLGREACEVRALLQRVWAHLRPLVIGKAAQPLRLWAC